MLETHGIGGNAITRQYDVAIIGAGIIGLATAYELLQRKPSIRLCVIEKEQQVARHQSGHNSGVLHAGLYYRPGSLKARLCREGKASLERFADEHGIPYERCGKLVVALDDSELGRLGKLKENALANGVSGLEEVGPERIRELEPHATGIRALYSPETGVIDFREVAQAYAEQLRNKGGELLLGRLVTSIRPEAERMLVGTSLEEVRTRHLISCAGLQSDRVAAMTGHSGDGRIVPFRGDYYTFTPEARSLVSALVYPVPDPSLPFLGVHFTRRIDGEVWAGPNAVVAFAREGYKRLEVNLRDTRDVVGYGGFWRLARKHGRAALRELWRDLVKPAFVDECRRYLPELEPQHLTRGACGVRAQLVTPDGSLFDDFSLHVSSRVMLVRNAPSPAATASPAIARLLVDEAVRSFDLA